MGGGWGGVVQAVGYNNHIYNLCNKMACILTFPGGFGGDVSMVVVALWYVHWGHVLD